jgi:hypothetical protein
MLNVNPYGNDYQYVVRAYASNEAGRVAKTQILIDEALVSNIRQQQENERLTALLESKHEKINDLLRQFELQDQHYLQQIKERAVSCVLNRTAQRKRSVLFHPKVGTSKRD